MCWEMEEIYSEGMEIGEKRGEKCGIKKGALDKTKEIAITLSEMGMSLEQISEAVKINTDTVKIWLKE